jgi:hypothetical protein
MEHKMKTALLLSTLAVNLIGATPSFAQSVTSNYSSAFGYPSYAGAGWREPTFGSSDYGYHQRRVGTGQVQPQRERK